MCARECFAEHPAFDLERQDQQTLAKLRKEKDGDKEQESALC